MNADKRDKKLWAVLASNDGDVWFDVYRSKGAAKEVAHASWRGGVQSGYKATIFGPFTPEELLERLGAALNGGAEP